MNLKQILELQLLLECISYQFEAKSIYTVLLYIIYIYIIYFLGIKRQSLLFNSFSSIDERNAYEVAEQDLRVLESGYEEFVQWEFEQFLIHSFFIQEKLCIQLDLYSQNLYLVGHNLQLVRLAIEGQAIDRID